MKFCVFWLSRNNCAEILWKRKVQITIEMQSSWEIFCFSAESKRSWKPPQFLKYFNDFLSTVCYFLFQQCWLLIHKNCSDFDLYSSIFKLSWTSLWLKHQLKVIKTKFSNFSITNNNFWFLRPLKFLFLCVQFTLDEIQINSN